MILPRRSSTHRWLLVSTLTLGATSLTGCHFFNRLLGKDSVDLSKANVQSMSVDIRKERKTICPREHVQMAVFAEVTLEGDKDKKSFETWAGHGNVNKNDKLDFVEFAFQSDQGSFDRDGWFAPAGNLLATAGKEFEIKTVYKKQPDKYSLSTKYKPDYQCIKGGGDSGKPGSSGSRGPSGPSGHDGQQGSSGESGGNGSQGGPGGSGGDGSNGGPGPHVVAYATFVKTPFYDKLLAVKISGDADDFLLAPADRPVSIHARGGSGGPGGSGGSGGRGGAGGGGDPAGMGGSGGQGGNGGKGGMGGPGGSIDFVYDARYPDIASLVMLDASGGDGGGAGLAGDGGNGGSGGSGMTPSGSSTTVPGGQRGADGPRGSEGAAGQSGSDGHAASHAERVAEKFASLDAVTLLDDPGGGGAAAVADAPPDPGVKPTKGKPPGKGAAPVKPGSKKTGTGS